MFMYVEILHLPCLAAILKNMSATHMNLYISEIKRPAVMIPMSKYRFSGSRIKQKTFSSLSRKGAPVPASSPFPFRSRPPPFRHKPILHVLSRHSQMIAQTCINSCRIRPNYPQDHEEKLQVPCCSNFQKGKRSRMRCDILCSHTIALFGNDAFIKFAILAKSG